MQSDQIVSILGAGAWGTALSFIMGYKQQLYNKNTQYKKHKILLYTRDFIIANSINTNKINPLVDHKDPIPKSIIATTSLFDAMLSDIIFVSVPQKNLRDLFDNIKDIILKYNNIFEKKFRNSIIVLCTKGIDKDDCLPYEITQKYFPDNKIAVMAGPNFAYEIISGLPATTTIASSDISTAHIVASVLSYDNFGVEVSNDLFGIQMCSAIKNLIAIGSGIIYGFGSGYNITCSYIAKTIREIENLIVEIGGNKKSIMTTGGIGDIILTSTNKKSRNYTYGFEIGQILNSKKIDVDIINGLSINPNKITIEGYHTAHQLKHSKYINNITLPICHYLITLLIKNIININDINKLIKIILESNNNII
ncbi:NAD(P)H-dependent glycerol-3-phosphate dehydrogenase [Lyticum sinuosum]|uniref:Glycerol-3-phosphate dehydrogenase n=1 Tax=Lyticum sinuosum TaxID=1332059 RepID=A0AAE4VKS5_9RICK|nr:NAD(P)H-dependent glycerol-3-phosphate dehydrogenase [Lyticum sinuosum]MDZ5761243.1 NAD(P)H-dependent glycerol-3-phosphate dehydrogenase [Lyticum sinuosum]